MSLPATIQVREVKQTPKPIRFYEKSVYGNTLIYPDAYNSGKIEKLTGKKTITEQQLECLKMLGVSLTIDRLPQ